MDYKTIFERSHEGRVGYKLPPLDVEEKDFSTLIPTEFQRETKARLPEVSELQVVRHYTNLSSKNHHVEKGMYPLGSCTMKYNPKINEDMASMPGFTKIHPYQPVETVQGALELLKGLQSGLCEVTGMHAFTVSPAAGAHGEYTGMVAIKAFHEHNGDLQRTKIIIPDSAHGTNPASAIVAGFETVEIKSREDGLVDVEALKAAVNEVGDELAGFMLTNPNTLGLFETEIETITKIIHDAGGQIYYDGANLNGILGVARPGDMGFDVCHLNLHKTFSTPHGGGGPGTGAVGVKEHLAPFLPRPVIVEKDNMLEFDYNCPESLGRVKNFYGNFLVNVRAFTYILSMGSDGLRAAGQNAVLNANYLQQLIKDEYILFKEGICMHETIFAGLIDKNGTTTVDVAKRMIDFGYHPPTVFFPLIVPDALMFEPTETETKETLDNFAVVMKQIAKEAKENPDMLKSAPHNAPVRRLDETRAARQLKLSAYWEED